VDYRVVWSNVVGFSAVHADVDAHLAVEFRQRLDTEVCDGDENAEYRDDGKYSRCSRAGRLLAQKPDCSLPRRTRHHLRLQCTSTAYN